MTTALEYTVSDRALLQQIQARLNNGNHWAQFYYALDRNLKCTDVYGREAIHFCLLGAAMRVVHDQTGGSWPTRLRKLLHIDSVMVRLVSVLSDQRYNSIVAFNDDAASWDEVGHMLERMISYPLGALPRTPDVLLAPAQLDDENDFLF